MYTLAQNTVSHANKAILRTLCKEHGIKNYGKMNNAQMRVQVNAKIMQHRLLQQAVKRTVNNNLLNSLFTGPVTSKIANPLDILSGIMPRTVQQKAPVAKRTKQRVKNDQWHPKKGGKTYAVWVQMRYALSVKKLGLKQAKQYVREYFANSDVHVNTVNAQIYRYCKYYGLTSR